MKFGENKVKKLVINRENSGFGIRVKD